MRLRVVRTFRHRVSRLSGIRLQELLLARVGPTRLDVTFTSKGVIMNPYFKSLLFVTIAAALFVPTTAIGQKSGGGVVGDARLRPGTWNSQSTSRSQARSQSMYRSTSPVIVRSERAPEAVAQVPTERRSFSYDPAQEARPESKQSENCCCGSGVKTEQAPATTESSTSGRRSFSYEPSMNQPSAVGQRYSVPRSQSSNSSKWRHTGSKDERNNYRN
jgi:hypothetical protein